MAPLSSSPAPRPLLLAGLAALALLAGGCRKDKTDTLGPDELARVNGDVIRRADFEQELTRELASSELPDRTPEQVEPFKRALLDSLIERALLLQAARELAVTVSEEEVDRQVLRIAADFPAGQFDDTLSQGQLSMAALKQRTRDLLVIEKLFATHVYPRVALTEAELRDAYSARQAQLQEPEQVRMAQIVVRELDEARRVLAQLKAGGKFAELARRYSLSADAKVGGDLGFFARGVMPPTFDEWAFRLSPGQLSEVVPSDYGFHIFKVLARKPARQREFAEVREELEARLLSERQAEAQAAYVASLKSRGQVRINEAALQLVTGRRPVAHEEK